MPDHMRNYAELQRRVADKRKARSAKPRPQRDPARRLNRKGSRPGFASRAARHVLLSGFRPLHNNIPDWLRMTAEELRAAAPAVHIYGRPARIRPHVTHDGGGGVFVAGDARLRPSFVV